MSEPQHDTVAIVDDDHGVRASLQLLLAVIGHKAEAFASAAEFLPAKLETFVCLILDQHMPHMTGLDLAAQLRGAGHAVPILLVTGSPSPALIARAAELGIDRVVEKPPDEGELLAFLERVVSRRARSK